MRTPGPICECTLVGFFRGVVNCELLGGRAVCRSNVLISLRRKHYWSYLQLAPSTSLHLQQRGRPWERGLPARATRVSDMPVLPRAPDCSGNGAATQQC